MSLVGFRAQNHPQQKTKDAVDDRGTDPAFVHSLEVRFGAFELDVAASPTNTKAPRFYTLDDDGLAKPWRGIVWCNPPYSDCGAWVRKAWAEWNATDPARLGLTRGDSLLRIVMLLPANRCEQAWWQSQVERHRDRPGSPLRVEFLPGRMRFDRPGAVIGPKGDRPPFGCCLLIWEMP